MSIHPQPISGMATYPVEQGVTVLTGDGAEEDSHAATFKLWRLRRIQLRL